MAVLTSIVIPVHNRAGLTRQCIDAILSAPPSAAHELVVVDDASSDATADVLAAYGDRVRVLTRERNAGFATACNEGAAAARGELLVFLNNDTIPHPGWLDALVREAERHPGTAAIGSKLLFPDGSVQHAGVVICQDGNPRHIYAGFPGDHPAVNRARSFQAVTAACMLVRRDAFEAAGGFDPAFLNCLEDTDLCLRLGELGHEVRYCPDSVLYHLESVSRGRRGANIERNARLFRERWGERARRDDLDYYVADDLLRVGYRDAYPLRLEVSPQLATIDQGSRAGEAERLLEAQARHVTELLRETVRLSAAMADLDLSRSPGGSDQAAAAPTPLPARADFLKRVEQLEVDIYRLQADLAAAGGGGEAPARRDGALEPSELLGYRKLLQDIRDSVAEALPADASILVASRGDDDLLDLGGRPAQHFPQQDDGTYAGYYPRDDDSAIAHLESLREKGARYLLLPRTSLWWLERYPAFGDHLRRRYAVVLDDESCRVFALDATS